MSARDLRDAFRSKATEARTGEIEALAANIHEPEHMLRTRQGKVNAWTEALALIDEIFREQN